MFTRLTPLALLVLLVGCSDKGGDSSTATDSVATESQPTESQPTESQPTDSGTSDPDVEVTTDAGLYLFRYLADPTPISPGPAALDIRLGDSAGAAVTGATLVLTPTMPSMGHGIDTPPVVTEIGGGEYRAEWEYSMGGEWEVLVEISGSEGTDQVTLVFQVG